LQREKRRYILQKEPGGEQIRSGSNPYKATIDVQTGGGRKTWGVSSFSSQEITRGQNDRGKQECVVIEEIVPGRNYKMDIDLRGERR